MIKTTFHPLRPRLLAAAFALVLAVRAEAQPPATPPQDPESAAAAAAEAATLTDLARRNPTVAAVLELPRETPEEKLRAILTLIDLGEIDAAALIVPDLLETALDDATRAELVGEFGSARFLQLMRLGASAGETPVALAGVREFAAACLDSAAKEAHNPQRLAQLIGQLQAADEATRYAARVDLRALGDPAIEACFAALAQAQTEVARANLLLALADLRPAVVDPLLAVLDGARGQLRRDAAELAGHLKLWAALPHLAVLAASTADVETSTAAQAALARLGIPAPTPADAESLVLRRLRTLESLPPLSTSEPAGPWWRWNLTTQRLQRAEFSATQLRTLAAARLARALAEVGGPATTTSRRLAVIRALEEAALFQQQPGAAVGQQLAAMSPHELSIAMGEAVAVERFDAATLLAAELGRRQDPSILLTADAQPSPLAAALASPVRRLRLAALTAIMELAPSERFPGSSGVAEALWYFAAGAGDPSAVAAAPVFTRASDWAGLLRGLGYDATPAATGRDAINAAIDPAIAPRLALVVLDSDIGQPLLRETLYQLRSSDRTARVPVLVLTSATDLAASLDAAEKIPLALAAPRPHGADAMSTLVERAAALADRPLPDAATRTAQAAQALGWIAQLLNESAPYDELRRDRALVSRTLHLPELTAPSLDVLTALGTADSQTLLADFASSPTASIDSRRHAARGFATNVAQFGKLLTTDEMLRQYDRYNASETADAGSQQVLGSILDVLEKKNAPSAAN